jgi:hypothetical protein
MLEMLLVDQAESLYGHHSKQPKGSQFKVFQALDLIFDIWFSMFQWLLQESLSFGAQWDR